MGLKYFYSVTIHLLHDLCGETFFVLYRFMQVLVLIEGFDMEDLHEESRNDQVQEHHVIKSNSALKVSIATRNLVAAGLRFSPILHLCSVHYLVARLIGCSM